MDKKNTIIGVTLLIAAFAIPLLMPRTEPPAAPPTPAREVVDGQPIGGTPVLSAPTGSGILRPLAAPAEDETPLLLKNDYVEVRLTRRGGAVLNVALLTYPAEKGGTAPFEFNGMHAQAALSLNGIAGIDSGSLYSVVASGPDRVVFEAVRPDGVTVRRSYSLAPEKDDYVLRHETTFSNPTGSPVELPSFGINVGTVAPVGAHDSGLYLNGGYYDGEAHFINRNAFEPGFFSRMFGGSSTPETRISKLGAVRWASVKNQFFTGIATFDEPVAGIDVERVDFGIVPGETKPRIGITNTALVPGSVLSSGASRTIALDYFAGPKEYRRLKEFAHRQDEVMQFQIYWIFGWASFFSKLLLACLGAIHSVVPNYGWSIILLTAAIKLLFFPLTAIAARSSKRMMKLAPKFKEVQEKYKDNPQKMQREIMGLYQKYGVNPVGGCIPILIQIPIFFGLFGMLQSASELRFAEWLWVPDLSMPDTVARIAGMPINVLPLIMTVTVIFQMKLTPTPPTADAFQAKLFKVLPIVFCVFSYFFAAGLVLYWTVNNLFTIGQQYYINRQPEPELVEVKPGKAGGFAAKLAALQEKAEEARRLQEEELRKKKRK